ncbi:MULTISPECIES: hypothetical protein [Enterococcus]|uniref:Uncharacterized protein n=1 Tax=Enterococcus faecium TaxID=1352 RepID=A0A6A8NGN7_ENTFC|nr:MULTISPECIES: hypothetical protein [Enterococcus]MBD9707697.1 hypothetical protein [Enterococcus faecium]MDT2714312.1 hypothetical protein [Enterococcus gallinarum]MTD23331.1 hypothetical protein [Enterococcus faecium]MTD35037.1 hypothetical protein [Enterococcus faecium]NQE03134.1 hypothetical protein [Enterococcus gallinarum]
MNPQPKTKQLIDKLVNNSLHRSYNWNDLSQHPNRILEIAFKEKTNNLPIFPFDSYWFENDKHIAGLIHSVNHFEYCIFLFNKKTRLSALNPIDTRSYYQLKTIIDNQIKERELLIDDFLDT